MRLERLVVQGFKSFADKVELVFAPGVTAVVGPNGSGKSNIADAIRWVLGEQSVRALRGQRMEDVIFAGSEGKRPLGMAEVTVTLDNSDSSFPLDYTQISVTRRLFRSGESEYLLNRVPCRLKDIADLFLDTGIGREGYALIGQGSIDAVLSSRPEERRALFEAAAGIGRYKARKVEALKKLEYTEQNLIRVGDILAELDKQLGPLGEQAAKARRYRDLFVEWEAWDLWFAFLEQQETARRLELLRADYQAAEEEQARLVAEQGAAEAELQKLNSALLEEESAAQRAHEAMLAQASAVERARVRLDGISDQRKNFLERKAQLEAEKMRLEQALRQADEKRRTVSSSLMTALAAVREHEAAVGEAKRRLEAVRQQKAVTSRAIESLKAELLEILNRQATLEAEAGEGATAAETAAEDASEEKRVVALLEKLVEARGQAAGRLEGRRKEYERRASALKGVEEERAKLAERRERLLGELAAQKERREMIARSRAALEARRQTLLELEREGAGFAVGVREVLRLKSVGGSAYAGIIGVVADLVQVPAEFETAIAVALGAGAQNVVTSDEKTARLAVEYLKKTGRGRVTFLPLDILKPKVFSEVERRQLHGEGVLGAASDLVRIASELRPALEYLLGRTAVATTLAAATELARRTGAGFRIVTLDGELISVGGAITGGTPHKGSDASPNASSRGILSRQRDLSELKARLDSLAREDGEVAEAILAVEAELTKLNETWTKAEEALLEARRQASETEETIRADEREIEHLAKREEELKESLARLIRRRERIQERRERARERLVVLQGEKERLERRLDEAERQEGESVDAERELADDVTARLVALAKSEEVAKSLRESLQRLEEEVRGRREELGRREAEVVSVVDRLRGLDAEEEACRVELAGARQAEEVSAAEWERRKKARQELWSEVDLRSRLAKDLASKVAEVSARVKGLDVERTRAEALLARLEERLIADHGLSLDALPEKAAAACSSGLVATDTSIQEARSRAESLRRKLREIGPVSLEAIEEYDAQSERYRFLKEQYEDLVKARASLVQTIERIDRTTGQLFRESFIAVNRSFEEVFRRLFGGGQARLSLTDPDNIEQTGVEVIVQPPGKKLSALSLLSGGERTMTAIALLMAFLRVRPAPFCVLDEIDAALDDANVRRFAALLSDFARQTQFIVITHRRGTMEIANSLYGVTMDETGVSKLVSVKLEEAG